MPPRCARSGARNSSPWAIAGCDGSARPLRRDARHPISLGVSIHGEASMTPQERDLVTALLSRLEQHGAQPKDADADALIRRAMAQQPDAPYYLVQTVLVQDMALRNAESRIAELERQLAQAKAAPAPQEQPQSSFLAGASRGSVPSAGAWTRSPPGAEIGRAHV